MLEEIYKVAVIIPCWNSSSYIGEMLRCLLEQSFQDWRAFVVDDQSTDNSVKIVEKYHIKDERISCVVRSRLPKGAQSCRNIGFEMSEGAEYVIWFDADDLIAPYCLWQRVAYMDRHPELDFGIFPAITFKKKIWEENAMCYGFPFFEDTFCAMMSWTLPMVGWTNIYRRKSVVAYGLRWDEKILSMQDSDFNIQSILLGLKFDYGVKEKALVDYFYRTGQNIGSTSSKLLMPEHIRSHLYLLNKVSNKMTKEQKRKYDKSLQLYHFKFAKFFKDSKEVYNSFLKLPWLQENRWFKLKCILWKCVHFQHTNNILLFRKLLYREYLETKNWHDLMNNQYKILLENQSSK